MTSRHVHVVSIAILSVALAAVGAPSASGMPQNLGAAPKVVELPAASVDGLASAIAQAGPRGVVLVRSGLHTESATVTIDIPVWIVGEPGAVLEVDTCPDAVGIIEVDAALHVLGARNVVIRGLEIRPSPIHLGACAGQLNGIGGTAILVEDAPHAIIDRNIIRDHQIGILLEHGDHASISENTIQGVSPTVFFNFGVLVLNGDHVQIVANEAYGAAAGIFTGDVGGKALNNNCHDNVFGIVL